MAPPVFLVCLAHFCELHGPSCVICTSVSTEIPVDPQQASALPSCASCTLVFPDDKSQLISESSGELDGSASAGLYVSAAAPPEPCRRLVSKLAIASLLVETSLPNNPTFHGNPRDGYCIHSLFKLNDTTARGQERKYALLVVCDLESHLLARWLIISIYLAQITSLISESVMAATTSGPNQILKEPYLRRLANRPRLLTDLTNDPYFFAKLHLLHQELLNDIS